MSYTIPDIEIAQKVNSALQQIENEVKYEKDFWGFIKGLPSMIVQDGLVQTMAFIISSAKGENDKYAKVYQAFEDYGKEMIRDDSEGNFNLIKYLVTESIDLEKYLYYENRLLQFAIWFKRIGLGLYADPSVR